MSSVATSEKMFFSEQDTISLSIEYFEEGKEGKR